jgi:hypothetical protein
MLQLLDTVKYLERKGYRENLTPCYDHLCCGKVEIYPSEIYFDQVIRFENASDPDDQAILYAISAPSKKIKGLYVDSYGLYHDELSPSILKRLQFCRSINHEIDALPPSLD